MFKISECQFMTSHSFVCLENTDSNEATEMVEAVYAEVVQRDENNGLRLPNTSEERKNLGMLNIIKFLNFLISALVHTQYQYHCCYIFIATEINYCWIIILAISFQQCRIHICPWQFLNIISPAHLWSSSFCFFLVLFLFLFTGTIPVNKKVQVDAGIGHR